MFFFFINLGLLLSNLFKEKGIIKIYPQLVKIPRNINKINTDKLGTFFKSRSKSVNQTRTTKLLCGHTNIITRKSFKMRFFNIFRLYFKDKLSHRLFFKDSSNIRLCKYGRYKSVRWIIISLNEEHDN